VSVTADNDGLGPAWDRLGDGLDHDRLSEDCSTENISDSTVRALPLCVLNNLHEKSARDFQAMSWSKGLRGALQ
jgi:hypothetical protein